MKKTLLVLVMAMTATVGCVDMSSFVPTSNNALVLDAQQVWVSKETKAPVIGTTFPTSGTMSISSYSSATSSTFFTDIPFSYNSTDGGWKANSSKYWPQTGTLDFLAYSCTGLTPTSVTWNSTNASSGITSFVTGDNRTAQADLMFGAASGCAYSPSSLPTLNFKHAMTLVTFTGLCPDVAYNGTTGITIESITLATAYYGGTCSVTRSGSTVNSISWSATANSYNGASVPGISSVGLPMTATPVGNGILLPPQSAVNFTINYKVWSGGVATSKSYTYTNSGTWEMAKRHVYAIEITLGNDVVVKAGVEDWADTAKNWFYADGNVVKNVGNEFTLASGQPVFWREGTTGAYQQLTYYSGTYGSSVTYSATNYFVTVTKSGSTYTVSYVSKNRTEYEYQLVLTAPTYWIEPEGNVQMTAVLQRRQRNWYNGYANSWSAWSDAGTVFPQTWSNGGTAYATVTSGGLVSGHNNLGDNLDKNVTISATWTSYLGGNEVSLNASAGITVSAAPRQPVNLIGVIERKHNDHSVYWSDYSKLLDVECESSSAWFDGIQFSFSAVYNDGSTSTRVAVSYTGSWYDEANHKVNDGANGSALISNSYNVWTLRPSSGWYYKHNSGVQYPFSFTDCGVTLTAYVRHWIWISD